MCWLYLMIISIITIALIVIIFSLKIGISNSFPNLAGLEDRQIKEFLSLGFSLFIILWGLYKNGLKPITNKWVLFLLGFLSLHFFVAPNSQLIMFGRNIGGFWHYQSIIEIWIFFLLACSIANFEFKNIDINKILKVLLWIGIIQSLYMICQRLGLDPWQTLKSDSSSVATTMGRVTGTFTHPTFASLFLAITIPITFYFKKYIAFILLVLGLLSADSQVSYGIALFCSLLYLFLNINKVQKIYLTIGTIILSSVFLIFFHNLIQDSGRFNVYKIILTDIIHPKIINYSVFLTGYGLGSYSYIFPTQHNSIFDHAHNDYLELFYNVGFIGLGLLFTTIFFMVKDFLLILNDRNTKIVFIILCGLMLSAFFTFTWQMEPFKVIGALIIGILYSRKCFRN